MCECVRMCLTMCLYFDALLCCVVLCCDHRKSLNFMSNAHFLLLLLFFLPYSVPDIGHVSIHPKMQ